MPGDADIASVAALLADPTRAGMLLALSDGRAFTAGELARRTKVAPSTASEHLTRLVESSLLVVEKQGRHRYFRLINPAIVEIMEGMALLAPPAKIRTLGESESALAVRRARMCYHHLAGTLGVRLTESLVEKDILHVTDIGYIVEDTGIRWLENMGINYQPLKKQGRLLAPAHIDWSERKHHVAGSLGAAIAQRLLTLEWIKRVPASRAIHLTEIGKRELAELLGSSSQVEADSRSSFQAVR